MVAVVNRFDEKGFQKVKVLIFAREAEIEI